MIFTTSLAILTAMVSSVAGLTLTSPPGGSTLSSEGLHSLTWTFTNTDPAMINIQLVTTSNPTAITITTNVLVSSGQISFSATLPSGNDLMFQCVNANSPSDVIAQSGPVNIVGGQNPFGSSTSLPANETISVFSAPAGTGSIPVSTITNAVLTTSIPTVELVVSSDVESFTSLSLLTTTTTLYTSPVNVTSTGTIIIPITTQNGNVPDPVPLVPLLGLGDENSPLQVPLQIEVGVEVTTVPPVFILPTFKKWKRVADGTSITLGAVTITGTRGVTTSTTPITQPATTIAGTTTTATTSSTTPPTPTTTATTKTTTQPPETVTYVTTAPGTIITITATQPGNGTNHYSPAPPPWTSTVIPPIITTTTYPPPYPPPAPAPKPNNTTTTPVPPQPEECAICTSGLINAGIRIRGFGGRWGEFVAWGMWIVGVALMVSR